MANYACSDPNTTLSRLDSATGPYLTVATVPRARHQRDNTNGSRIKQNGTISCTGQYDLSVKGLHVFTVKATDTGGNVKRNVVIYNVK